MQVRIMRVIAQHWLFLGIFFVAACMPLVSIADEIDTVTHISDGGITIVEGDTITRYDLTENSANSWSVLFDWPNEVPDRFVGGILVFHGIFGDLVGGVPVRGTNYTSAPQAYASSTNDIAVGGSLLSRIGGVDFPTSPFTVMVLERDPATIDGLRPGDYSGQAEWFASGGTSGIAPVKYAFLTFQYDATVAPQELNAIENVMTGDVTIVDGDTVTPDDFTVVSPIWSASFNWPNSVQNDFNRGILFLFQGEFGDLVGGAAVENGNYYKGLSIFPAGGTVVNRNLTNPPIGDVGTAFGVYTFVVMERDLIFEPFTNNVSGEAEWFASGGVDGAAPLRYATLTFQYQETPEPLDPLLLQYEPVLYLHPEENYQPLNVEAFVEASALFDDNGVLPDTIIEPRGAVTIEDISVGNSSDWYLAFSSDSAKTFDVAAAKSTYDQLVLDGKAVPTYYGYKTEDSFTDEEGVLHEFIVLQYWYFYAFNDWLEQGGFNNHEGDWESVFVFLDKATETPQYVAYSAHHNEGEANQLAGKFDSVRRDWNSSEVVKDSGQVVSFVSLGSHANYPNNGNQEGNHVVPTPVGLRNDRTSLQGTQFRAGDWLEKQSISEGIPGWMIYQGKWGADGILAGANGPFGPNFSNVSGNLRFHKPIEWAGIDKIGKKEISVPTKILEFVRQLTTMNFVQDLLPGTEVIVDLHDENITFGENITDIALLPHFWDIESNLTNDTFETEIAFQYDQVEVDTLELTENSLSVFLYNEAANLWEKVTSTVNAVADTVSFSTTHFSRYAIGVEVEQTPQEKLQAFRDYVTNSDIKSGWKRVLIGGAFAAERFIERDRSRLAKLTLFGLERFVQKKTGKGISEEDAEALLEMLQDIRSML